jgi:hypothetical protein
MTAGPCRVSRRRPGWPGAGSRAPGQLTPVTGAGSLAVHAEEFRPGGEVLAGDSPDVAVRYAEVFARLMAELASVTVRRARAARVLSSGWFPEQSSGRVGELVRAVDHWRGSWRVRQATRLPR